MKTRLHPLDIPLLATAIGLILTVLDIHPTGETPWLFLSLLGMIAVVASPQRRNARLSKPEGPDAIREEAKIRALIVGAGTVGQSLAQKLQADERYEFIGFVDDESFGGSLPPEGPVLGCRADLTAIIREHAIEEVFLAYTPSWQQAIADELAANQVEARIRAVPSPYEALMRPNPIENLGDIALVPIAPPAGQGRQMVKRAGDVTAALIGLALGAPLMLLAALLIRLTSRGPVIFAQERVGYLGEPFILYKFRTMVVDAEASTGPTLSSGRNDARLTPVGKWLRLFRIDELPQLWNVLKGDMSLVGPRPERPHFVRQFQQETPSYALRHKTRPGITGLAQVCGDYHTDARDKLRFDLIYIAHQSLWLDISILLRTVRVVLFPKQR